MSTALVTGAAGFIGSHLVEELLDSGWSVNGIDNLSTGCRSNLGRANEFESFEFIQGDVCDADTVRTVINNVDVIFHQAAVASVPQSFENPRSVTDINCGGTATILQCANEAGVETVVVASSSAVYGSGKELPKHEGMSPAPESPYGLSKLYTEQLTLQLGERYGIDTTALRYFNVFGPCQDPDGEYAAVIPKFAQLMSNGDRPIVFGDGNQTRDFVFVDDVVSANLHAAESEHASEVFNIGRGRRVGINELVDSLNELLEDHIEPIYDDPRPGDIRHSVADISKAREQINYEPTTSFKQGLRKTLANTEQEI